MNLNNLCMGCMREKPAQGKKCPYCGYDDAISQNPAGMLPIWTILHGAYVAGKTLGDGGFGKTYIGFDLNLEKKVAIKEFFPHGCAQRAEDGLNVIPLPEEKGYFEEERDHYVEEARILASLQDKKGVVNVLSYFRENNTAYIVMEYIEGISLREFLCDKGGKIGCDELLYLMKPVIAALADVHSKGIIHKDISPENIMVDEHGSANLIDFGAAYDKRSGKREIKAFKKFYSPPEQMSFEGVVTTASDIYSLCATLYYGLTGCNPDDAGERIKSDRLNPPSDIESGIDPMTDAVIMNGLALLAEDRISNASDLYYFLYKYREEPGSTPEGIKRKVSGSSTKVIMEKIAEEKRSDRWHRNIIVVAVAVMVMILGFSILRGIVWARTRTSPTVSVEPSSYMQTEPQNEKTQVDVLAVRDALYEKCGRSSDAELETVANEIAGKLVEENLATRSEWDQFIISTVSEAMDRHGLSGTGWYVAPVHGDTDTESIKSEADHQIAAGNQGVENALDLNNSSRIGISVGVHEDGTVFVVFLYAE